MGSVPLLVLSPPSFPEDANDAAVTDSTAAKISTVGTLNVKDGVAGKSH